MTAVQMKAAHLMLAATHRRMRNLEQLAGIIRLEVLVVQERLAVHPGQAATAVTMCGKAHCITLNNWKDYPMAQMMGR